MLIAMTPPIDDKISNAIPVGYARQKIFKNYTTEHFDL